MLKGSRTENKGVGERGEDPQPPPALRLTQAQGQKMMVVLSHCAWLFALLPDFYLFIKKIFMYLKELRTKWERHWARSSVRCSPDSHDSRGWPGARTFIWRGLDWKWNSQPLSWHLSAPICHRVASCLGVCLLTSQPCVCPCQEGTTVGQVLLALVHFG